MSGTRIIFPDGSIAPLPDEQDAAAVVDRFQAKLREFHQHPVKPVCDCMLAGRRLEVVIRRLPTDRFILARMPNLGPFHRESCAFHAVDADRSGQAGYATDVIVELKDGGLQVRLQQSLTFRNQPLPSLPPNREAGRPGSGRQGAMTALGLLHLLWEEAGLNRWHPGFRDRRPGWLVAACLEQVAEHIKVVRTELAESFTALADERWSGGRLRQQAVKYGKTRRLVLVAVVQTLNAANRGVRNIRLVGGARNGVFLSAPAGAVDALERRFPYAARLLAAERGDRPGQVIGLFIVTALADVWRSRPVVWATMEDGAFMEANDAFVPVASDLERQVADRLVAEDRAFIKPLRFDADAALVLPDFVLADTGATRGTPMEVFGRHDPAYVARQAEKISYYRDAYGVDGWWQWNPAHNRQGCPAFPLRG